MTGTSLVKQLKQQAREYVLKEHRESDLYNQEFHDLVDLKFAELAVQECTDIVMGDEVISWADSIRIKSAIEGNFGVK